MPEPKSTIAKLLPFIAGLFVLILLAGFSLGLRTVIEFDAVNTQMRTSKFLFLKLPIIIHKQELWFADGTQPVTPIDWQLMHEFHHSATGSKLDHTHWGAIADMIIAWDDLELDPKAKARLAVRANDLVDSDLPLKSKRTYTLIIDSVLRYTLDALIADDSTLPPEDVDSIFDKALAAPLDP